VVSLLGQWSLGANPARCGLVPAPDDLINMSKWLVLIGIDTNVPLLNNLVTQERRDDSCWEEYLDS
jgi:hypothetical protein